MKYLQVTIGASTTQLATGVSARWITIQNNQAHVMRVGDQTASVSGNRGILLANGTPGGSVTTASWDSHAVDLSTIWVSGTQNDVVDVFYLD